MRLLALTWACLGLISVSAAQSSNDAAAAIAAAGVNVANVPECAV